MHAAHSAMMLYQVYKPQLFTLSRFSIIVYHMFLRYRFLPVSNDSYFGVAHRVLLPFVVSAKKSKDVTELQIGVKKSSGGVLLPNLMVEIVSVGAEAGRVEAGKKEAELGRKVICLDMWERLKMKPGGTYVSDDAAEKALLLEKAHDSLKTKYGDSIPQALDFEVGSEIIGWNKRTKLPKAIGAAATLVEGSKFNRIASLRIGGSSPTPSSQLDDVAQEVTQLKQQHQKMEFQIQQQQVIINLTQALLKTSNSQPQPPRPDQDEDDESSD